MLRHAAVGVLVALNVAACSGGSDTRSSPRSTTAAAETAEPGGSQQAPLVEPPRDAVLYTIGASTDPYGNSAPGGFGVVVGFGTAAEKKLEVRRRDLGFFGGAEWIGERRMLVPRDAPPFRPPLIFRLDAKRLIREGPSPLPALHTQQKWSPDGKLIASKSIQPCKPKQRPRWKCYRQADPIYLQRADGSGRRVVGNGYLNAWTADGRLILAGSGHRYTILEPWTKMRTTPLSGQRVAAVAGLKRASLGAPRWSADGRYLAAMVAGRWPKAANAVHGFVIAHADGQPIRVVTSPYLISMFAWSPRDHQLAWTTSGFPTPHELFVLDEPAGKPRRLVAADPHFDWITWAPHGRRLLLDDENAGRWLLITAAGPPAIEKRPRLGGQPLWCCPVNAYATFNE